MKKKKENKPQKLMTTKMPGETPRQYSAWLLYCETGSFDRLLRAWKALSQKLPKSYPEFEDLVSDLGQPVSRQSIKMWSKKYHWVERTELQLEDELTELNEKTTKFRVRRKYFLTDILMQKMNKLRRRASEEDSSVLEVKYLWEMHRTEFGESTGKTEVNHRIDESEQTPEVDEPTQKAIKVWRQENDAKRRPKNNKKA